MLAADAAVIVIIDTAFFFQNLLLNWGDKTSKK